MINHGYSLAKMLKYIYNSFKLKTLCNGTNVNEYSWLIHKQGGAVWSGYTLFENDDRAEWVNESSWYAVVSA